MNIFKNSIQSIKIIFILSLLALAALSVFSYKQNSELIKKAMLVNHTNLVKIELGNNFSFLKDAETGNRGYILTSDSSYLEPYYSALKKVPVTLKNLDSLLIDNPKQTTSLQKLKAMSLNRLLIIEEMRSVKNADINIVKYLPRGKVKMDEIRIQTDLMILEEERLLNIRTASLISAASFAPLLSVLFAGLAILLLTFSYLKILREFKKSQVLQKQLKVSNQVLEQSNSELAQFAYVASHDLQEPLRKIQTFISRIEETEKTFSEKGKDYFDRIKKAANTMQQLILDILTYSKINNTESKKEIVQLADIINASINTLEVVIKDKNALVTYDALPAVNVVKHQFEQLFTNLISNALKFSKKDVTPVIKINAAVVKNENLNIKEKRKYGDYLCISVADNGIGFEPKYEERIFNIFNRLNTKEAYEGNGIGLSIVKKIMDAHGGIVNATGKKNNGAVFNVYLPL